MGMPAARLGDVTSHGTPLTGSPGCPTVTIAGQPAWRVGDVHACPLVSGVVPHVGGAATFGSATVLIGGLPAARVGDQVLEIPGGPNVIAQGAPTVLIG